MLVLKSAHDAAIAAKDSEIASLAFQLATVEEANKRLRRNNQTLGKALHEKVAECDELRPDAEKYRRSRANLKQFRQPSVEERPY